jgi:hypothetical protein
MAKKIVLAIVLSFILTLTVTNLFFFKGVPKVNALKVKRMAQDIRDEAVILKNTLTYKLSSSKIDYDQVLDGSGMTFEFEDVPETPYPTIGLAPTTFVPSPTFIPPPTPTDIPVTSFITNAPGIPTKVPTKIPTKKPTKVPPTPTPSPAPTKKPANDSLFIKNPLDQPYYNPRLAYKCYNADKFIEVYGGGGTGGACYGNAKAYVDRNLTSVSILGKSITVHKDAYPYFQAVSNRLKDFKGYKINTIGAYVFRCNVNASSVDRFDLCAEGCVLSAHAFGIAVDINWEENCNGCDKFDMPREIIDAFESYGFRWGGRYKSIFGATIDPMHFELMVDLCRDVV